MNLPPQHSQMRSQLEPGYSPSHGDARGQQAMVSGLARAEDATRQGATAALRAQDGMLRAAADQQHRMATAMQFATGETAQAPKPLINSAAQRFLAGYKRDRLYPELPGQGVNVMQFGRMLSDGGML